jgi:demethylspheroidene O-methyltransferase
VAYEEFLERLYKFRDQLIASPRFQRWSLSNPLTRPIARRRARAALDLTAGFVYSQILFSCLELKLFDFLGEGSLSLQELSARLELSEASTMRLLTAAASLNLVERRGLDKWGLGQIGAALTGNSSALALIRHQSMLYRDLVDPVALLKGKKSAILADYWPYSADEITPGLLAAEQIAPYSALMAASQPMLADEILHSYDISRYGCLLDIGGGEGVFIAAAAKFAPDLSLKLFDLPAVAERARENLRRAQLLSQVDIFGGNFLRDKLPLGADIVTLIRIIHDHDDQSAIKLLKNIRSSVEIGAKLLIIEAMSGVRGAETLEAYYGFYTLAMGRGTPRRVDEIKLLLKQSGFGGCKLIHNALPTLTSILEATAI